MSCRLSFRSSRNDGIKSENIIHLLGDAGVNMSQFQH